MYPWPANSANSQLPAQVSPHRAWTEGHVPPAHHPRNPPNAHGPRSASFSDTRPSSLANWNDLPPPPPLPPLPPSLLPGFHSPPLAHSDRDILFVESPRLVQLPQKWSPPLASPGSFQSLEYPPSSQIPNSAPLLHSQQYSGSGPAATPLDPSRLTGIYASGNAHSVDTEGATRSIPYVPEQHLYMIPSPPPAVPPHPMTAHGDMRFPSSDFPPALPPKPFESLPLATLPNSSPPLIPSKHWLPSSPNLQLKTSEPVKEMPPSFPEPRSNAVKSESGHLRTQSADDIARAIELSLAESQSIFSGAKQSQGEEDLNLQGALAHSLAESHSFVRPDVQADVQSKVGEGSGTQLGQTPPLGLESHGEAISVVAKAEDRETEADAKRLQKERDIKAALRRLMEQEERRLAEEKRELERRDEEMARQQAEEEQARKEEQKEQERRDAEMAQKLANADEAGPSMPVSGTRSTSVSLAMSVPQRLPVTATAPEASGQPPPYYDVVASAPVKTSTQNGRPRPSTATTQWSSVPPTATSQNLRGRAATAMATNAARSQERAHFSRASSVGAVAVAQAGPARPNAPGLPPKERPDTHELPPHVVAGPSKATIVPLQGESVELELLRGVSFGFEPPKLLLGSVQPSELPHSPPFPEVISLYLAPKRPFHIMALSWRHMMRLLAQFETRIEASVGTIAVTKRESILRVVVQFVKLPYTVNEWRTIIHLSVDQPVPQNMPQAWRFTNGDTTVLPYSIALGETPPYLRMSAISHVYAVPLSSATPFPILPLALPNLALYLQSAMRDSRSRRIQNDTSNAMQRLARLVSSCYPEEVASAEEERESGRGVGGLFKRVLGRGAPKRRDTEGNEDVYDMVTPFRIDQYFS